MARYSVYRQDGEETILWLGSKILAWILNKLIPLKTDWCHVSDIGYRFWTTDLRTGEKDLEAGIYYDPYWCTY